MALNQTDWAPGLTGDPVAQARAIQQEQQRVNLAQALQQQQMQQQASQAQAQNALQSRELANQLAVQNRGLDIKEQALQQKPFSLEEALFKQVQRGQATPETYQGLGMRVAPQSATGSSSSATQQQGYNIQDVTAPEGFQVSSYDEMGRPELKRIPTDKGQQVPEYQTKVSYVKQKMKDTADVMDGVATIRRKQDVIGSAREAVKRLPTGLVGKAQLEWKRNLQPNDPILEDWQTVKSVLTDAQLLETAKTKGAISDSEMKLLSESVGNDDLFSLPRINSVLVRMFNNLEKDARIAQKIYRQNYGEQSLSDIMQGYEQQAINTRPMQAEQGIDNQPQDGMTATNPTTGEKIVLRNGQWQPLGGGA